jgi:DNA-binding NarL/FixJ family response regulator
MPISNRRRPRVRIADDHMLVAETCKHLLEDEFQVVGVVGKRRDLLAEPLKPDLVILDIAMPQQNGLEANF